MSKFEPGMIVKGKVTGIKPFGAFVALDANTQGLVHISQITHGFLKDINEALTVGDEVDVKILTIDEQSKKISLSIKDAKPAESEPPRQRPVQQQYQQHARGGDAGSAGAGGGGLDDLLKKWMKDSNERQAALNKRTSK